MSRTSDRADIATCRDCGEEKPFTQEFFYRRGRHVPSRCTSCEIRRAAARTKRRNTSDWIARVLAYARGHDRSSSCYEKSDLDRCYIQKLYDEQDGRCAWTGVGLALSTLGRLDSVSLDRLDASRGYVKWNVALTCLGANLARNRYSEADMVTFIQMMKETK